MKKRAAYQNVFSNELYPVLVTRAISGTFPDLIYCHWHEAIEYIYVAKGCLALQIDMKEYIIQAGELAMVNSGQVHFGNSADNQFCEVYALIFKPELLSFAEDNSVQGKYIDPLIQGKLKFPPKITSITRWGKRIIKEVQALIDLNDQEFEGNELFIKAHIYTILAELFTADALIENSQTYMMSAKLQRLKMTMEYIHNHFQEKLYIKDLADELNMSEDNFYKYFKGITGRTPTEYINLYRIHMAEQLLVKENLSVTELCYRVGFDNISYFIKTFKKYHGCTPKQYLTSNLD